MPRGKEQIMTGGSRSGMMASAALGPQLVGLSESANRIREAAARQQAEAEFQGAAAIGQGLGQIGQAATGAIQQKAQIKSEERMMDKKNSVELKIAKMHQDASAASDLIQKEIAGINNTATMEVLERKTKLTKSLVDEVNAAAFARKQLDMAMKVQEIKALEGVVNHNASESRSRQVKLEQVKEKELEDLDLITEPLTRALKVYEEDLAGGYSVDDYKYQPKEEAAAGTTPGKKWLASKIGNTVPLSMLKEGGLPQIIEGWKTGKITGSDIFSAYAAVQTGSVHQAKIAEEAKTGIKHEKGKMLGPRKALVPKAAEKKTEEYIESYNKPLPNWMTAGRWVYNPLLGVLTEPYEFDIQDPEGQAVYDKTREDSKVFLEADKVLRNLAGQKGIVNPDGVDLGQYMNTVLGHKSGTTSAIMYKDIKAGIAKDDPTISDISNEFMRKYLEMSRLSDEALTPGAKARYDELYKAKIDSILIDLIEAHKEAGTLGGGYSPTNPNLYEQSLGGIR